VSTQSDQSPDALITANLDLVRKIAGADYPCALLEFDDLVQQGCLGLIEAARTFREKKGCFTSWASLHIHAYICKALALEKRRPDGGCGSEGLDHVVDHRDDRDADVDAEAVWSAVNALPQYERELIIRMFGFDWERPATFQEVAGRNHSSTSTVRRDRAAALKQLKSKLTA
jgi:RNA polymerase sigma factor (sigma-70 family)